MSTPLCASCGSPLPAGDQQSLCDHCEAGNHGPAASWAGAPTTDEAMMRIAPQRSEHAELGQTCLFCNKSRDPDLAVYSVGAGRLGICLECARKAVEALQPHEKAAASA